MLPQQESQTTTCTDFPPFPALQTEPKTKRFELIGIKHKEEHYYFLEGKLVWGFVCFYFVWVLFWFFSH